MNYEEVLENARKCIGPSCKACPVCNGKACGNKIPGPGAKGAVGDTAIRNFEAWQNYNVNMDTLFANADIDTSLELFGRKFRYPIFAGPVGAVNLHYSDKYTDVTYNDVLVSACAENGIAANSPAINASEVKSARNFLLFKTHLPFIFIQCFRIHPQSLSLPAQG